MFLIAKLRLSREKQKNAKKQPMCQHTLDTEEKAIERKMAKNHSKAIISGTSDFDPEDYLIKSLLFDLKKTREEKILHATTEKYLTTINITSSIEREQTLFP